jgi:hypothetical protein
MFLAGKWIEGRKVKVRHRRGRQRNLLRKRGRVRNKIPRFEPSASIKPIDSQLNRRGSDSAISSFCCKICMLN